MRGSARHKVKEMISDGLIFISVGASLMLLGVAVIMYDKLKAKRYDIKVDGEIIDYEKSQYNKRWVTVPVIQYEVNNSMYTCLLCFKYVVFSSKIHAKYNVYLDDKFVLHMCSAHKYDKVIDYKKDLFPIGAKYTVHYKKNNPQKAYCGAKSGLDLVWIISMGSGMIFNLIGILICLAG
jgi:hypothetical protein